MYHLSRLNQEEIENMNRSTTNNLIDSVMKQLPTNKSPRPDSFTGEFSVQSVQFSRSVMVNSLWPHGLQYARLPSPSPMSGACSNSCPSSLWCHPTISFSIIPFYSCLQSFPVLGSFPMSQLFTSGGQSIGVSASALVLPMNIQDWSPLGWTGWISLQSKGLSIVFSNTIVQSINSSALSLLYGPTLTSTHDYWKNHSSGGRNGKPL